MTMRFGSIGLALVVALTLFGGSRAVAENVDLPRSPSISPDGRTVVFTWRGDLWRVPAEGGRATRLTSHPGVDGASAWSPDGRTIVFESDRDGYRNLWAMNPDGRDIRQVTTFDRSVALAGVARDADGTLVATVSASVEGDLYRSTRPYSVALTGGPLERLVDAFGGEPRLGPDGRSLLFTRGASSWTRRHYRGPDARDVWLAEPSGEFRQLTDWPGNDGLASFADANTMLFLSDRQEGTTNLYRQRIEPGGAAERLTMFDETDVTSYDVAPGAGRVVLQAWDTLYLLDLDDARPEARAISITANEDSLDSIQPLDASRRVSEAALSPDGSVMAYVAYGEVWVRNVEDGSPTRRVTDSHAHDRGIAWSPDGVVLYFTSDRDGTDSIFAARVERTRGEIRDAWKDATDPEDEDADDEDADDEDSQDDEDESADDGADDGDDVDAGPVDPLAGTWACTGMTPAGEVLDFTIVFTERGGGEYTAEMNSPIYSGPGVATFDASSGRLSASWDIGNGMSLSMTAVVDGETMTGTGVSPDGQEAEITATRTDTPGASDDDENGDGDAKEDDEDDEVDPRYDRARWKDALRFTIEPVVATEFNDTDPTPSPDGHTLAFRRSRGDIVLLDLETGEERPLMESWDFGSEFVWNPDGDWLAVAVNDRNFNSDVWIVPVDDPDAMVNVSRHPDNDGSPRFSADSRILVFTSERSDEAYDVYRVHLDPALDGMLEPELKKYYEDAAAAAKKRGAIDPVIFDDEADEDDADDAEDADVDEAEESVRDWEPSLDDAYRRVRRMSFLPGNESSVRITPAGDLILYSASGSGPGNGGVWSVKWDGSGAKRLGSGSMAHVTPKGDKLVTTSGGQGGWIALPGGSDKRIGISARMRLDLEEQSSQKFHEAARILGEVFYHPTMKGLDWPALTERYHDLARRAHTADEFNWVAARFIGELNASHLGVRAPAGGSPLAQSQGRLGTVHKRVDDGFKVISILPDSPAAIGPMPLEVGDIITAVDFETFEEGDTLEQHLAGRIGDEVVVSVKRPIAFDPEGNVLEALELDALVTPISYGAFNNLRYEQQQRDMAAKVDEMSDGRVGYIHIRGMNQPSLDEFERDLYAACEGKDGLIIDVRNNGGGWTADRLMASITVRPHAYTIPRGAPRDETDGYPQDRLFIQRYVLPINMLCNEKSFSNAEITSHAFKALDRGTLVGQTTYGGVISTGGTSLIDGTFVRLPFRGWYLLDGTDMENNGAIPDIIVEQTPEDESASVDAQLRTAVEDLMKRLD